MITKQKDCRLTLCPTRRPTNNNNEMQQDDLPHTRAKLFHYLRESGIQAIYLLTKIATGRRQRRRTHGLRPGSM